MVGFPSNAAPRSELRYLKGIKVPVLKASDQTGGDKELGAMPRGEGISQPQGDRTAPDPSGPRRPVARLSQPPQLTLKSEHHRQLRISPPLSDI